MSKLQLLSCLCILMLSGCALKLSADFEADTVGAAPSEDLAGPPNGDTVTIFAPGSVIVADGSIGNPTNVLRFEGDGTGDPQALFFTAPIQNESNPVYLLWDGEVHVSATVDFDIFGSDDQPILRLRMSDGDFIVNSLNEGSYFSAAPQKLLVTLFPDGRYIVSGVEGFNFAGAECNGEPGLICGDLENADSFPSFHVRLVVRLRDPGTFAYYEMDNLRISQRNPS